MRRNTLLVQTNKKKKKKKNYFSGATVVGGSIKENLEFLNEFLKGITSYLKSCNQLNFLVTRHFELVTRYAKIEFPGSA